MYLKLPEPIRYHHSKKLCWFDGSILFDFRVNCSRYRISMMKSELECCFVKSCISSSPSLTCKQGWIIKRCLRKPAWITSKKPFKSSIKKEHQVDSFQLLKKYLKLKRIPNEFGHFWKWSLTYLACKMLINSRLIFWSGFTRAYSITALKWNKKVIWYNK